MLVLFGGHAVRVDGYVLSIPSPGVWLTVLVNRPYDPVFNVC